MRAPQTWAPQKMMEEVKRHQKRDMDNFLTMRSEPTPGVEMLDWVFVGLKYFGILREDLPLQRRPTKLKTERMETCTNWRSWTKRGDALSS